MESKRLLLTNLIGLAKRKRAPQKVRPSPTKAKTVEVATNEATSTRAPKMSRVNPILVEGSRLYLDSSCFRASFLLCRS